MYINGEESENNLYTYSSQWTLKVIQFSSLLAITSKDNFDRLGFNVKSAYMWKSNTIFILVSACKDRVKETHRINTKLQVAKVKINNNNNKCVK